jgi:serine/threonine protein kinase
MPVLIDFGSTSIIGKQSTSTSKSGYSPPEQLKKECWPCSDLYALGKSAIALLTGKVPNQYPTDWSSLNVSVSFKSTLMRLTAEDYRERFESAQAVLAELKPVLPQELLTKAEKILVELIGPVAPLLIKIHCRSAQNLQELLLQVSQYLTQHGKSELVQPFQAAMLNEKI